VTAADNVARMDHNAMRAVVEMRRNGMAVDLGHLRGLGERCQREMDMLAQEIEGLTGVAGEPGERATSGQIVVWDVGAGQGLEKKMTRGGGGNPPTPLILNPIWPSTPRYRKYTNGGKGRRLKPRIVNRWWRWRGRIGTGIILCGREILWTRTGTGGMREKPQPAKYPGEDGIGAGGEDGVYCAENQRPADAVGDGGPITNRNEGGGACEWGEEDGGDISPTGVCAGWKGGMKKNKNADLHIRTAMAVFKIPAEDVHPLKHRYR